MLSILFTSFSTWISFSYVSAEIICSFFHSPLSYTWLSFSILRSIVKFFFCFCLSSAWTSFSSSVAVAMSSLLHRVLYKAWISSFYSWREATCCLIGWSNCSIWISFSRSLSEAICSALLCSRVSSCVPSFLLLLFLSFSFCSVSISTTIIRIFVYFNGLSQCWRGFKICRQRHRIV